MLWTKVSYVKNGTLYSGALGCFLYLNHQTLAHHFCHESPLFSPIKILLHKEPECGDANIEEVIETLVAFNNYYN